MKPDDDLRRRLEAVVAATLPAGRPQVEDLVASVVDAGGTSEHALVAMLRDQTRVPELRSDICWLIPRLAIPASGAILGPLLSDPSEQVRAEAAAALGLVATDEAVDLLLESLERDRSRPVRLAALHSLGISSSPRATQGVLDVLRTASEDEAIRADAAEALAHFEDERIASALIDALHDASPLVRYSAAYALGQQGEPDALPLLTEIAGRDHAATPWGSVASSALQAIDAIKAR